MQAQAFDAYFVKIELLKASYFKLEGLKFCRHLIFFEHFVRKYTQKKSYMFGVHVSN